MANPREKLAKGRVDMMAFNWIRVIDEFASAFKRQPLDLLHEQCQRDEIGFAQCGAINSAPVALDDHRNTVDRHEPSTQREGVLYRTPRCPRVRFTPGDCRTASNRSGGS